MVENNGIHNGLTSFGRRLDEMQKALGVNLKDYIDSRFYALKEATDDAKSSMERRLDGMNEFRNTLKDQAEKFVQITNCRTVRKKYDEKLKDHDDSLKSLELTRAELSGKASRTSALVAGALGLIGFLMGVAGLIVSIAFHK